MLFLSERNEMQLKRLINLYRAYPYWQKSGCIFIHVPKGAGTSVNQALFQRTLGHYRAEQVQRRFPDLYEKSFVFTLVRNPWGRALSAYRFAKAGRTESMGVREPEQYQVPAFESFERFVHEWLAVRDVETLDFIFQPQYRFVCGADGKPMTDFVGKVETIASDMRLVEERLRRPVPLRHANRTADSGSYAEHYDRNMIDVVAKIYARDIATFQYDFQ